MKWCLFSCKLEMIPTFSSCNINVHTNASKLPCNNMVCSFIAMHCFYFEEHFLYFCWWMTSVSSSSSTLHVLFLRTGGVSTVTGHMTRKMWGLIPVLDCSQLLSLCPSQYKPSIATPKADSPPQIMSGKILRGSATLTAANWHWNPARFPGLDRGCASCPVLPKYREF